MVHSKDVQEHSQIVLLVVDDDSMLRRSIQRALTPLRYRVYEAGSLLEAKQRIHTCSPDILLVDLIMPGHDGFDALRELAAFDRPIVVMSGWHGGQSPDYLSVALSLGADASIRKPFEIAELDRILRSALK